MDEKTEAGKVVCKEDGYVARALDKTETALLDMVTAPTGQSLTVGSQDVMVSVLVVSTVMAGTTTGMSVLEAVSPGKTRQYALKQSRPVSVVPDVADAETVAADVETE